MGKITLRLTINVVSPVFGQVNGWWPREEAEAISDQLEVELVYLHESAPHSICDRDLLEILFETGQLPVVL
jgi:hypothetical protein